MWGSKGSCHQPSLSKPWPDTEAHDLPPLLCGFVFLMPFSCLSHAVFMCNLSLPSLRFCNTAAFLPPPAGAAIHGHLAALLPPLLTLASSHPDVSPQAAAAHQAVAAVALSVQVGSPCAPGCAQADAACRSSNKHVLYIFFQPICARAFNQSAPACVVSVQEDGLYLLMQELQRGLEEPARRRGAATVTALFCRTSKLDFQEHVPALITVGCSHRNAHHVGSLALHSRLSSCNSACCAVGRTAGHMATPATTEWKLCVSAVSVQPLPSTHACPSMQALVPLLAEDEPDTRLSCCRFSQHH